VSPTARDFTKATVVTLVLTGLGYILSGWVVGVLCLFVAGSLSLILWTPFGAWLGFHRQLSGVASGAFVAVEGEISLAAEEAGEMATMLRREWPYITPDGALVETALPDWKDKTTDFIAAVLGSAQRAAFKSSGGDNTLERLESEGRFLVDLAQKLTPDAVRANESEILEARKKRREHQAASFLAYDHSRAPGAPPPDDQALEDQL
jgi:hypothetical protein